MERSGVEARLGCDPARRQLREKLDPVGRLARRKRPRLAARESETAVVDLSPQSRQIDGGLVAGDEAVTRRMQGEGGKASGE